MSAKICEINNFEYLQKYNIKTFVLIDLNVIVEIKCMKTKYGRNKMSAKICEINNFEYLQKLIII